MAEYITIKGREIGKGAPIVCVPVMAPSAKEIINDISELVQNGTDMIEWRVDTFENYHSMNAIREILAEVSPIVKNTIFMFTYRSKKQGGCGEHNADLRRDIHDIAGESHVVDIVDVEYFTEKNAAEEINRLRKMGMKVMSSHHDFDETPAPEVLRILIEEEYESGADMVKLAMMPKTMDDVLNLFSETYKFHKTYPNVPIITMSMGRLGGFSRFLGEYSGSCISWGAWKWESAPGQLDQIEVKKLIDGIHRLCQESGD